MGTRFGLPLSNPRVIADKLATAKEARAKRRTAKDVSHLVGCNRTTLYRHLGPRHQLNQEPLILPMAQWIVSVTDRQVCCARSWPQRNPRRSHG